jgi:hypothetical protein
MKPRRPLGLSLAIAASVLLYSVLPVMQVAMVVIVQLRFSRLELSLDSVQGQVGSIASGGDLMGVPVVALLLQAGLGTAFLLIAAGAWIGRPRYIRGLMLGWILGLTALTMLVALASVTEQPTLSDGLDSGDSLRRSLDLARLIASSIVALYVLWYMNRGPARAFYRGYYLPAPGQVRSRDSERV